MKIHTKHPKQSYKFQFVAIYPQNIQIKEYFTKTFIPTKPNYLTSTINLDSSLQKTKKEDDLRFKKC